MPPIDQASMVHVVMWRLHENADGHTAAENAVRVKAALEAMRGLIPGMTLLEVGIDTRRKANSFDVVLISVFDDAEALEAYHDHPDHNAVKPLVQAVKADTVVVDYPGGETAARALAGAFASA